MEHIAVGRILTTHGLRGQVKIQPLTSFPDRLYDLDKVYIYHTDGSVTLATVDNSHPHKRDQWLLAFKEFDRIEDVEGFRGALLKIDKDKVAKLPEGHYYVFELVGCSVLTADEQMLGVLVDVISTGANDVYVVSAGRGKKDILIPAIREVVRSIDISERRITVTLLPGLVD